MVGLHQLQKSNSKTRRLKSEAHRRDSNIIGKFIGKLRWSSRKKSGIKNTSKEESMWELCTSETVQKEHFYG